MSTSTPVLKDCEKQHQVPTEWRSTLVDIVEAMKEGDFQLSKGVPLVRPVPAEFAVKIAGNIKSYGARLTSLPEESWKTSACQWMGGYWDVLVDLYTVEEGASDLALVVRVYESDKAFTFEVQSVHVP